MKDEACVQQFTIGQLAEQTSVSTDTLRYYEKIKLLRADRRSDAGYRLYGPDAVRIVRFIRGAQSLNFTLDEIRALLKLNTSDQASCAQVLKLTEGKIAEAEAKILELKEIKKVLGGLIGQCPGDDTSIAACPILDHIKSKTGKAAVLIALGLISFAGPSPAIAKPISYVGGVMAMQENDETGNTLSLDYTITPNYALGLYAKHETNGKDYDTVGPQLNSLLKRWNLPDGQANIFNMTGVGVSTLHGSTEPAVWTNMLADYETRRIFTSYEVRLMDAQNIERSAWQRARIGVAPYLANYDDVSTWFMVQVDDHPAKDQTWVVTPLVRFFYHTTLIEAGYSSNHHLMANWTLQF
ncbi:MAG: heavy metal-responsive transcriptional regulator [Proteobacteria bacterium]|nr:heavy metal-responsive transcriptional regulator [Pseudomonadota bacterium]